MEKFSISDHKTAYGKTKGDQREFALCSYYGIERTKHDSKAYHSNSDVELPHMNISIKASGATLMSGGLSKGCKTFEGIWRRYRKNVHSNYFAYISTDYMVYLMNLNEFSKFIHTFGRLDRESTRNGGGLKIKLLNESNKMLAWLDERAAVAA